MWTVLVIAAVATLVLGVWQWPFINVVQQAVNTLALR
jgi:hypothetical protein